jgi:hypothetical protein
MKTREGWGRDESLAKATFSSFLPNQKNFPNALRRSPRTRSMNQATCILTLLAVLAGTPSSGARSYRELRAYAGVGFGESPARSTGGDHRRAGRPAATGHDTFPPAFAGWSTFGACRDRGEL